jgi:hypothetical protein
MPVVTVAGDVIVVLGAGTTVKLVELVAVPPGVVTLIAPVVTVVGATAVIDVALFTEKLLAAVPLNFTAVAPVKAVPVKVTVVIAAPLVGVKLVMVGAATTVKLVELVAVPPGVVTLIFPVVVPVGTVVAIDVAVTVPRVAAVPLNFTLVAPERFVPVMVTGVPTPPLVGVKLVIVGAATTVKLDELVTVPPGVVTLIFPVEAPVGTVVAIEVAVTVPRVAAVPLNFTLVAPVRFVPVMVTGVPTPPLVGLELVIVGAATNVKLDELVTVPPGVVTLIFPVVVPVGTVVAIDVAVTVPKVAAVPLNFTLVAPERFVPVMVTGVPTPPLEGLKLVMVGAEAAAKERPAITIGMKRPTRREGRNRPFRTRVDVFVIAVKRRSTAARLEPAYRLERATMINLVGVRTVFGRKPTQWNMKR